MPISGQTALTTIALAKEQAITYQPILLCEMTFGDGSVLYLSSENLDGSDGGFAYGGHNYQARLRNPDIGAIQSVSDNGITQSPQVTFTLADADKELWLLWEVAVGRGFKGARCVLRFVYWDAGTNTFSSDFLVKFDGICNPPQADDENLTVLATNKLNLQRVFTPTTGISRNCPWVFPVNKSRRIAGAVNEDCDEFPCGYSWDVTDIDTGAGTGGGADAAARGNPDPATGLAYTACTYDWQGCIARMGNIANPSENNVPYHAVQIEEDTSHRHTARFGGVRYDPPDTWRGKAYISGTKEQGINNPNIAKFNDFFPLIYGEGTFVQPPVMNVSGDPNSTRFEVAICVGPIGNGTSFTDPGGIQQVIVNDFIVPFYLESNDQTVLRWSWVNQGTRDGNVNRDSPWAGMGDPYGSIACISIVVPQQVADSGSIPNVKVLTSGPAIRYYNSSNPSDYSRIRTANAAMIIADYLTWCGMNATSEKNDLDLAAFVAAAAVCEPMVSYTDLKGMTRARERYRLGFGLRDRAAAAGTLNGLLLACKGMLSPNASASGTNAGKLRLTIKQTLADQQPTLPLGSNYTGTGVASARADGTTLAIVGFPAYVFDESNILRKGPKRNSASTFTIEQRPISDTPNYVSCNFQDEDFAFSNDSETIGDALDISRTGQTVTGSVQALGVTNFDIAKRVLETQLAEQYRGNPRSGTDTAGDNDSGGTIIVNFQSTSKAIYLQDGQIILVSQAKYNIVNQQFRILAITINPDAEIVTIRAQWTEDDWFLDSYGQNPSPLLQAARRHGLLRPPFGWLPNFTAPQAQDAFFDPTAKSFGFGQAYQLGADQTSIALLRITGFLPVNNFSPKATPPFAPEAEAAAASGTIANGTYWVAAVGIDSTGMLTPPSSPVAKVTCAGGNSAITLPNIYWPSASAIVNWKIYAGTNPNKLSLQASGSGAPSTITFASYNAANEAMPDVMFDHLLMRTKRVFHAGVFGAVVSGLTSTTIEIAGYAFGVNEWATRNFSIIGQPNNTGDLPIWDFLVGSNDATSMTLASVGGVVPNPVTLGVQIGDVVIMRTQPTSFSADTIGDAKFVNEVQYFTPPVQVVGVSNTTPIVVATATAHGYFTGDNARVQSVLGNSAANGQWVITVPTTADLIYNETHVILDGSAGNGDWANGGQIQLDTDGLVVNAEKNNLVRLTRGTGRGQVKKIASNTNSVLTIEGVWDVMPDATTGFIVEENSWLDETPTASTLNGDPTKQVQAFVNVANWLEQVLWTQVFSLAASGAESVPSDSPGREIYLFGGDGGLVVQYEKATFGIAIVNPIAVGDDVCPHLIVRRSGKPISVKSTAKVPSAGAAIVIDIIQTSKDGLTHGSIFLAGDSNKINIPAGSTDIVTTQGTFHAGLHLAEDDLLTVNVTQVGSTQPGQIVTVVLKWTVD